MKTSTVLCLSVRTSSQEKEKKNTSMENFLNPKKNAYSHVVMEFTG